ncbi:MAG TPA: MscL family protein, partial [bacterium]|nr:MscL family protein [bacterium]
SVVDFTIIAFSVFLLVKLLNSLQRKKQAEAAAAPPEPSPEVKLLTEIRDLLKR